MSKKKQKDHGEDTSNNRPVTRSRREHYGTEEEEERLLEDVVSQDDRHSSRHSEGGSHRDREHDKHDKRSEDREYEEERRHRSRKRSDERSRTRESSRHTRSKERAKRPRTKERSRSRDHSHYGGRSYTRERSPTPLPRHRAKRRKTDLDPERFMTEMTYYFDSKFNALKREIVEEHESISEKIDKKLRNTEYVFRRKTNKFQYEHNLEINTKLHAAKNQLSHRTPNIKKATEALEQGMKMNNTRNKHLIISDKSDAGWATVEEYLRREVASDSEDDKRIRKAEVSASRIKSQKMKSRNNRFKPFFNNNNNRQNNNFQGNYQNFQPNYNNNYNNNNNQNNQNRQFNNQYNRCHICNEYGHWKNKCPRKNSIPAAACAPQQ